jgi:hypothetical protein
MYVCMHICVYVRLFLPQVLCTVWCLFKLYEHKNVKTTCKCFPIKQQHGYGTSVRSCTFNARLLARSQFASGRFCDRPTRSRFSVVFLGPKANAECTQIPRCSACLTCSPPNDSINKFRPNVALLMSD